MRTVQLVYVFNDTPLSEKMGDLAWDVSDAVDHPNKGNVATWSVQAALDANIDVPSIMIISSVEAGSNGEREIEILRAYKNVPTVAFMKEKFLLALNDELPESDTNTGSNNGGGDGVLGSGLLDLPVPKFIFAALTIGLGYKAIKDKDYASGVLSILSGINYLQK